MGSTGAGATPHPEPGAGTGGTPNVPPDRYGPVRRTRPSLRGWRLWVLLLFVLALASSAIYFGYQQLASTPIEGQRVAFDERPGNTMEITVDVLRDDPDREAVCIVRVRDISGAESGRKELYVPPHQERLSTVVDSIREPVTADIYGCSYEVPDYLSTP